MKAHVSILLLVVSCGSESGDATVDGGNDPNADAKVFMDAPPIVPQMITISGVVSERSLSGTSPIAGLAIAVFEAGSEATPLAMATTDAQGAYSLSVETGGAPLDGYLRATKSGYLDVDMYPASPFVESFTDGEINMITTGNFGFLNNLATGNQMAGMGFIGLQIRDANDQPVAGATVSSSPAASPYRYNGSNELPSSNATSTGADGIAYMFNVPSNTAVTISATKAGMTFKSHVVRARADKFTTTSITE